jgi:hypothetical protein
LWSHRIEGRELSYGLSSFEGYEKAQNGILIAMESGEHRRESDQPNSDDEESADRADPERRPPLIDFFAAWPELEIPPRDRTDVGRTVAIGWPGEIDEDESVPMELKEAVARALALHKHRPTSDVMATIAVVIPVLMRALDPESEHDQELHALAESWLANASSWGRRSRDLAVELARSVARARGMI